MSDIVGLLLNDILPRDGGSVAMLKAYLDRGAKDGAGRVVTMAGAVFWPYFYDQFLHEWQPFLDGWQAKAFHATDFYSGAPPFDWKRPDGTVDPERRARHLSDSKRIPDMIGSYVEQLFVVCFREEELETVAPEAWRTLFGNVHRVAAQMIAQSIGYWARRTNQNGEIAYFYELGDGDDAYVADGLLSTFRAPEQRKHARMAATPIGVEKGKAHGLEVADFLAWHWNKFAVDTMAAVGKNPRPLRKDIDRLMRLLHLRDETKIDVRLISGDNLVRFLLSQGCTVRNASTV